MGSKVSDSKRPRSAKQRVLDWHAWLVEDRALAESLGNEEDIHTDEELEEAALAYVILDAIDDYIDADWNAFFGADEVVIEVGQDRAARWLNVWTGNTKGQEHAPFIPIRFRERP